MAVMGRDRRYNDNEIPRPRHRSTPDPRANRKAPGLCPICGTAIPWISGHSRRARHCQACGGGLNKEITCPHCRTQRVWTGKYGCICHGCGRDVPRPSTSEKRTDRS